MSASSIATAKLGDVADLNPPLTACLRDDEDVSFLPMSAVVAESANAVDRETRPYAAVKKGYTAFVAGDVLVAKITPCFENGKIAHAHLTRDFGFGSTEFHVVRPRAGQLDARYLVHYLRQDSIRRQGESRMTGSAGQRRVPEPFLAGLDVPVPPLVEQRRIAEILDKADTLRAKRRVALAQLDTLTQSIFLDMFGDPVDNLYQFPVRRMIDLVDPARPISYGILMPGSDQSNGVKYVRVVDMRDGGIELSGLRQTTEKISNAFRRSLLRPGDLLMSIRGHVGRLAIVPTELDGANITQDTARLAVLGADPVFVRECLRTQALQRWMARHTKGVAVRGINLGDVKLMPIPMPIQSKQNEFARLAATTDDLRRVHRASLSELDALFASLQHRAFRGEL